MQELRTGRAEGSPSWVGGSAYAEEQKQEGAEDTVGIERLPACS